MTTIQSIAAFSVVTGVVLRSLCDLLALGDRQRPFPWWVRGTLCVVFIALPVAYVVYGVPLLAASLR